MIVAIIGRHFLINGRVQGVYYRRFAQKEAANLGITGWARNLADGRVEIKAFGPELELSNYAQRLKKGPIAAQVLTIDTLDIPLETFGSFEVL